jgi:putative sigma-54 modulation protein
MTVPKELRDYLAKKLPRLEKHLNSSAVRVELIVAKDGPHFLLEIHLRAGTIEVTSKQKDTDPKRGIDVLVDKIERAIARIVEKQRKVDLTKGKVAKKLTASAPADGSAPVGKIAKPSKVAKVATSKKASAAAAAQLPFELTKLGVRVFPTVIPVDVETMSTAEAGEKLFFQDENFLVFRHDTTDRLAVMFRRKDGNFGIVEPQD